MAQGPNYYSGSYVPPPATPDAQWIAQMRAGNVALPTNNPSLLAKLRALFAEEQGSTNLFTPGGVQGARQSMGTVQDMVRARLEAAAAQAQAAQQIGQTQAVLGNGASAADMAALRARLGPTPASLGNTGVNPLQAALEGSPQGQAMQQLGGQLGPLPQQGLVNTQMQVGPRALSAGPPIVEPNVVPSSGQTFTAGSQGVSNPGSPVNFSTSTEMVPYTGGQSAAGAMGAAETAAEAGGRWSKLGDFLKMSPGDKVAAAKDSLIGAGGIKGLAGGIATRGLTVGAPVYFGTQLAAPLVGGLAERAGNLAGAGGGTSAAAGQAFADMGKGFATGYTLGGPVGGLVGEGVAGVQAIAHGVQEGGLPGVHGQVDDYSTAAGQFQKWINKKGISGTDMGDNFVRAAHAIHQGRAFQFALPDGTPVQLPALGHGANNLEAKTQAMTDLVGVMQQYKSDKSGQVTSKSDAASQALKMGQAMATLMQPYTDAQVQGNNALRALQSDPNLSPTQQALVGAQASVSDAYAKQMQGAYVGAAAIQPTMTRMDQQLAQYNTLLQQINAARQSNSGQSLSGALAGNNASSSAAAAGLIG